MDKSFEGFERITGGLLAPLHPILCRFADCASHIGLETKHHLEWPDEQTGRRLMGAKLTFPYESIHNFPPFDDFGLGASHSR
jgi:hypothetical protein